MKILNGADFERAAEELYSASLICPPREHHFFARGTSFTDEMCVRYFSDCDVYVHTRDGHTWFRGEDVSPPEEIKRLYGVRVVKADPVVLNREMRRLRQRRKN